MGIFALNTTDVTTISISSWNEIHAYQKPTWLYRGQRSKDWKLSTSLERCCEREDIAKNDRLGLESELLREVRRVYHHYSSHVPAESALIEWISLMQHHGAPTRLLDCTYSIYVAAYFALEAADCDCAIWGVNGSWALRESVSALHRKGKKGASDLRTPTTPQHEVASQQLFFQAPFVKVAVPLTPFRLNERLRTQLATFLVPGDVSAPCMENLMALPNHKKQDNVVKLVLPKTLRADAMKSLWHMNISRRSLFPGLDGYSKSLGVYHPCFRPEDWR